MDWFMVQLQQNKDFTFLGGSYCTCSLQHILGCNDLASKVRPSWHGCLQTCRAASVAERTWKDHKIPPAKPSPHRSWPVFVGLQGIHLEIDGRMQLLGCAFGCASHSVTMDLLGHVGPRFNLGVNSKLNERGSDRWPPKKAPLLQPQAPNLSGPCALGLVGAAGASWFPSEMICTGNYQKLWVVPIKYQQFLLHPKLRMGPSPGFIPLPPFPGRPTDPLFAAAELQWAKWSIMCRYLFVSSNVVISCNPNM